MVDGVLLVSIPARMSLAEEAKWVEEMRERFVRKGGTEGIDLTKRADRLAARFGLPTPSEIVWSDRQSTRWGSCTPATRRIRISTRVAAFPDWVVDYVIVHELAHLVEPGHGRAFWSLVESYPDAARARGYLEAKSDGR